MGLSNPARTGAAILLDVACHLHGDHGCSACIRAADSQPWVPRFHIIPRCVLLVPSPLAGRNRNGHGGRGHGRRCCPKFCRHWLRLRAGRCRLCASCHEWDPDPDGQVALGDTAPVLSRAVAQIRTLLLQEIALRMKAPSPRRQRHSRLEVRPPFATDMGGSSAFAMWQSWWSFIIGGLSQIPPHLGVSLS